MSVFKKSVSLQGKYKEIAVSNGEFVDPATGEIIDVIGQLAEIYGDNVFTLTTSYKADEDLETVEE